MNGQVADLWRYPVSSMAGVGPVRSREKSDPDNGIVYYETPLAKALLGAEEGDEVTVLVGNQVRAAKIEEIIRVAEVSTH